MDDFEEGGERAESEEEEPKSRCTCAPNAALCELTHLHSKEGQQSKVKAETKAAPATCAFDQCISTNSFGGTRVQFYGRSTRGHG